MARYELRVKPSAAKEIVGIGRRADRQRVVDRIAALTDEPRPPGCRKLSDDEGYRLRQGEIRIVYTIDDRARIVRILKVAHRREVYRSR